MHKCQINPFDLISEQLAELHEKLNSTVDTHEKHVLHKRLNNLQAVMQFLDSAQTDKTIMPANSHHRAV